MRNNETNSQFALKYKGNGFKACDKHPDLQNPPARGSRWVTAIPRNYEENKPPNWFHFIFNPITSLKQIISLI